MPLKILKYLSLCIILVSVVACGSNKKNVPMQLHSDPLGAYVLIQVKYKGDENADWVFLGPTPVIQTRKVSFKNATTISLKVIRPGFYEQVKSWKAKDFLKEYKQNKEIMWIPSLVQQ